LKGQQITIVFNSERAVLNSALHKRLLACETEHQVVTFVTPYLEELVQELEHSVVVNSEEYRWLQISDDAPS
jgi:hypothetical protein